MNCSAHRLTSMLQLFIDLATRIVQPRCSNLGRQESDAKTIPKDRSILSDLRQPFQSYDPAVTTYCHHLWNKNGLCDFVLFAVRSFSCPHVFQDSLVEEIPHRLQIKSIILSLWLAQSVQLYPWHELPAPPIRSSSFPIWTSFQHDIMAAWIVSFLTRIPI